MCNFFSCIVLKDGSVHYDEFSDSHETTIERLGLKDDTADPKKLMFARVEITPPNGDVFADVSKWELRIDQLITPSWWSTLNRKKCIGVLKGYANKHIFINSNAGKISNGRVWLKNSSAELRENSSAELWGNSRAVLWENSSAELWENSRAVLWGNSSAVLWGNSSAELRGDSSAVLRGNSSAVLRGNSRAVLWGNSSAELWENSRAVLWGNSSAELWENSSALSHHNNIRYVAATAYKTIRIKKATA